jgi:hypothetical protein
MYPTERDFITLEYQRQHRLMTADKERLISSTLRNNPARVTIRQRMMVNIGTWLVQLGCRLKSQYVEIADLEMQSNTLS